MAKTQTFEIDQKVWIIGGAHGDRPAVVLEFDPKRPSRRTGRTCPAYCVLSDGYRLWVHRDMLLNEKPARLNGLTGRFA